VERRPKAGPRDLWAPEDRIRPCEPVGQCRVGQPGSADRQEADDVRQVRRGSAARPWRQV